MRKKAILAALGVLCFAAGGVVVRAASGTPEIDNANATLQLTGTLKKAVCFGEDGITYQTYKGSWTGAQTENATDTTDYSPMTGPVVVSGIKWTVNTQTLRGVLTGTVTLTNSSTAVVYKGALTLVTVGVAGTASSVARGWLSAGIKVPDEGTTPGDDSLIANVEFAINPTSGAQGLFGDLSGSFSTPNFSVVTNVAPKAADGTC